MTEVRGSSGGAVVAVVAIVVVMVGLVLVLVLVLVALVVVGVGVGVGGEVQTMTKMRGSGGRAAEVRHPGPACWQPAPSQRLQRAPHLSWP